MARLIFDELRIHKSMPSKKHLLYNKFSIFKAENIHKRLTEDKNEHDGLSFLRFIDTSPGDLEKITLLGLLEYLLHALKVEQHNQLLHYRDEWWRDSEKRFLLLQPTYSQKLKKNFMSETSVLRNFIFTSQNVGESIVYTHQDQFVHSMQETTDHRIIRSRHAPIIKVLEQSTSSLVKTPLKSPTRLLKSPMKSPTHKEHHHHHHADKKSPHDTHHEQSHLRLLPEFPHVPRESRTLFCEPTNMPKFLFNLPLKVHSRAKKLYVESRAAAWEEKRFDHCDCKEGWELIDKAVNLTHPIKGWSYITIPDKQSLVADAGK